MTDNKETSWVATTDPSTLTAIDGVSEVWGGFFEPNDDEESRTVISAMNKNNLEVCARVSVDSDKTSFIIKMMTTSPDTGSVNSIECKSFPLDSQAVSSLKKAFDILPSFELPDESSTTREDLRRIVAGINNDKAGLVDKLVESLRSVAGGKLDESNEKQG